MKRRDFLLFRREERRGVLELSCTELFDRLQAREAHEEVFGRIAAELHRVEFLRVVDHQAMSGASDDLRRGFGDVVQEFRERGGQVEYRSSD